MAKSLYFYSDVNQTAQSNAFRAQLQADNVPFTELRLGTDLRKHNVQFPGIQAVIEVDGTVYQEVQNKANVRAAFTAAPASLPAPAPPVLSVDERDLAEALTLTGRNQSTLSDLEKTRVNQLTLKLLLKLTGGTL